MHYQGLSCGSIRCVCVVRVCAIMWLCGRINLFQRMSNGMMRYVWACQECAKNHLCSHSLCVCVSPSTVFAIKGRNFLLDWQNYCIFNDVRLDTEMDSACPKHCGWKCMPFVWFSAKTHSQLLNAFPYLLLLKLL